MCENYKYVSCSQLKWFLVFRSEKLSSMGLYTEDREYNVKYS